jgi:hypothetical protein
VSVDAGVSDQQKACQGVLQGNHHAVDDELLNRLVMLSKLRQPM